MVRRVQHRHYPMMTQICNLSPFTLNTNCQVQYLSLSQINGRNTHSTHPCTNVYTHTHTHTHTHMNAKQCFFIFSCQYNCPHQKWVLRITVFSAVALLLITQLWMDIKSNWLVAAMAELATQLCQHTITLLSPSKPKKRPSKSF